MTMYRCDKCDDLKNSDYEPPEAFGATMNICPDCVDEIEDIRDRQREFKKSRDFKFRAKSSNS